MTRLSESSSSITISSKFTKGTIVHVAQATNLLGECKRQMRALKTIRQSLPPDTEPGVDTRAEIEYAEKSALADLIAAYDAIYAGGRSNSGLGVSSEGQWRRKCESILNWGASCIDRSVKADPSLMGEERFFRAYEEAQCRAGNSSR